MITEKKIEQEVGVARKNAKTNKRAALQALKRKKRYEKQLQQIDGTLSTIEMQREALGKFITPVCSIKMCTYLEIFGECELFGPKLFFGGNRLSKPLGFFRSKLQACKK